MSLFSLQWSSTLSSGNHTADFSFSKTTTYRFIWKLFTVAIQNSFEGNPIGVE
jgi:hypothetical protein